MRMFDEIVLIAPSRSRLGMYVSDICADSAATSARRTSSTFVFRLFRFGLPITNAALCDAYDFRYLLYSPAAFKQFQCAFASLCQLFTFSVWSHNPYYDIISEIKSSKFSSFLFPLTIWFAELPTYFGYCMPRLEAQLKNGWLAWIIASFFLAAQHVFLPLILNGAYLLWRFGMFLPFALITGLALKLRPGLLPYFVVVHALIDITTVLVYLMI